MNPVGEPHNLVVQRLTHLLILALAGRAAVRCQMYFAALEFSQPEPDFAIVSFSENDAERPSNAFLIIEVAESSLAADRGKKLRLYASCGIPEY